jgi:hypothetical protein
MDPELQMAYTRWSAIDNSRDIDVLRFDLTLAVFTEAYKITKNPEYLTIVNTVMEQGIKYMLNEKTHLFATRWYSRHQAPIDTIDLMWASALLNSMFEACTITANQTHLDYACKFADALYTYGINHATNLPYVEIYLNGSVSPFGWSGQVAWVPWAHSRLIATFIKAYEVTKNATYNLWALQILQALWSFRDARTSLLPLFISADGLVKADYTVPCRDPIQNVLTYAFKVTNERYYLDVALNLTNAQLWYGWNYVAKRMNGQISLNGAIKQSTLDLDDGPQMFIIALMQLQKLTNNSLYGYFASTFWNTLHQHAKINGLYVTQLCGDQNIPSRISRIYCAQMMVQCDAFMYYFTRNETYFADMLDTIDNFVARFNRTYGYVSVINVDTLEVGHYVSEKLAVDTLNIDWLDTSNYLFGPVIYLLRLKENDGMNVDPFYYMPYYPMLKVDK